MSDTATENPKDRMLRLIAERGGWDGWIFESCGGFDYFTAVHPRGTREAVHVAWDGSIRYSDSERFGQFWSLGVTPG